MDAPTPAVSNPVIPVPAASTSTTTPTPTTAQTIAQTALKTAETLAPTLLAVAGATDPKLAAVTALAPIAITFLQDAIQLQNIGVMTPEQLAALFANVGQGIQASHTAWAAMNGPAK